MEIIIRLTFLSNTLISFYMRNPLEITLMSPSLDPSLGFTGGLVSEKTSPCKGKYRAQNPFVGIKENILVLSIFSAPRGAPWFIVTKCNDLL